MVEERLTLEIGLPVSSVLKKYEKEAILNEVRKYLADVPDLNIVSTKYRERHAEGLPLELIIEVVVLIANVITIVEALSKIRKWASKPKGPDSSPEILVRVGENSYSIKGCKTAEDVKKIIREIKRR